MSTEHTLDSIHINRDDVNWGRKLLEGVKTAIGNLDIQFTDFKTFINTQLEDVVNKVEKAQADATKALTLATTNSASIELIQSKLTVLSQENTQLRKDNNYLKNKVNGLENYSRRDNTIVHGLKNLSMNPMIVFLLKRRKHNFPLNLLMIN